VLNFVPFLQPIQQVQGAAAIAGKLYSFEIAPATNPPGMHTRLRLPEMLESISKYPLASITCIGSEKLKSLTGVADAEDCMVKGCQERLIAGFRVRLKKWSIAAFL
jgi:hypothetical protein